MFGNQQPSNMFDRPLWHNGPRPGAFYNFPSNRAEAASGAPAVNGVQRTS